MSKPRWIDAGLFRTLRTATRKRTLAVVVGPQLGTAEFRCRADVKDVADRASLKDDPRTKSDIDPGLVALWSLRQPGLVTTSISDALAVSAPKGEDEPEARLFGPNSKGLNSAWSRKDPFVVRLCGAADKPDELVLTNRDRKVLLKADSRYQAFLRATFSRTVLFVGFELGDPDLSDLLDDVARCFNGHVPPNIALVPAGSADPAAALRANMHYGMTIVEFPAQLGASGAVAEAASLLEELEVPKPATGNPPPGFQELNADFRGSVAADDEAAARFDEGDTSGWAPIQAGLDVPRTVASGLSDFVLGDVPEGKVAVSLLRAQEGEGKTTMLRRLAWKMAEDGCRVFWREAGAGLPDRYVPAEADEARAYFVCDDAEELAHLPVLLRSLAQNGAGKARFILAADDHQWDRSGLDHRIRVDSVVHEERLSGVDEPEAEALADALEGRGRLAAGRSRADALTALTSSDAALLGRLSLASLGTSIAERVAAGVEALSSQSDVDLLKKAYLATAYAHCFGMSLGRAHLAALLGVPADDLEARIVKPLGRALVGSGNSALRTPHPIVARTAVQVLGGDEAARDELVIEMLKSLPGGSVDHPTVFHAPSELIRARRHEPIAPLVLGRLFEAGEEAARNDVLFWFDRGRYDTDFSRWEAALAAFDQALWRRPDEAPEKEHNALVHANRARCLQSLGRKREALAAAEEGLRLSPQDSVLVRLAEKLGGRRRGPPRGRGGPGGGQGGRGGRGGGGGGRGGDGRRPRAPGGGGGGRGQAGAGRPGSAPRA